MKETDCRRENGNCITLDADRLPVQCVHPWVQEKHDYLRRYVEASANPRAQFLPPMGSGGAAFIDLFAGPGRARIAETRQFIDGSPLLALKHAKSPFSRVLLCENDKESCEALQKRTAQFGQRVKVFPGDCNELVEEMLDHVPQYGLNIALIDPYNVSPLLFSTIEKLGRFVRMDLLIHFPTSDMRRKFGKGWSGYIDRFLGTTRWQETMTKAEQTPHLLVPILREQLVGLGYEAREVRAQPVKGPAGNVLYHMVYASKSKKGSEIWQGITRIGAHGQREMF